MFYNLSRPLDNGSRLVGKHMMGNTFYDMASNFHLSQARKKRKINLRKMKKGAGRARLEPVSFWLPN